MSGSKDYIVRNDSGLLDFAKNLSRYGSSNYSRWGITVNPESNISELLDDYELKLEKSILPNSGIIDKKAKNVAKEKLIKALRSYVQGFIARNPNVTDEDKLAMRLPVYDREPTPVGKPLGEATADVKYLGKKVMQLYIKHVVGTPLDEKADYGYKIYYGKYADSDTQPTSGQDLRENKFTRKKKEVFEFMPDDAKKTVYFCIRYENSKGETGPWGPMISATIP